MRLALNPHPRDLRRLDGGWWPRSRDARVELPMLVAGLKARLGAVVGLTVDERAWDEPPPRIVTVAGREVEIAGGDVDQAIVVTLGRREHLLLLVIPPDAGEDEARAALSWSVRSQHASARSVLEQCGIAVAQPALLLAPGVRGPAAA